MKLIFLQCRNTWLYLQLSPKVAALCLGASLDPKYVSLISEVTFGMKRSRDASLLYIQSHNVHSPTSKPLHILFLPPSIPFLPPFPLGLANPYTSIGALCRATSWRKYFLTTSSTPPRPPHLSGQRSPLKLLSPMQQASHCVSLQASGWTFLPSPSFSLLQRSDLSAQHRVRGTKVPSKCLQ